MIGRRFAAALAGTALIIGLTGCAATGPIDGSAAAAMQDSVVAVAQMAAGGDPTAANAKLDELQTQLDSAIDDDLVTAARAASIQNAIDAVRTDLATLIAAATRPEPAPAESTTPVDTGSTQPTDNVGDTGSTNPNSGPGNNSGNPDSNNGKGKGKKDGG
ncbi:hypothetical protein ACSBPH_05590 [Microbacterium sp. F51-2R]|uniref:hypothetical protein n=1 Tax=Microbacterium sp. F51-2R TaxID=3445777 RepID=UPI003F9F915E